MMKYALSWLALLATAFLNATIRELTYGPIVGKHLANQLSVITGVILLGFAMYLIVRRWPFSSQRQAILIGVMWATMTEVFEFTTVCVFQKQSVQFFLGLHNILNAEFWPVILLWLFLAPYLLNRIIGQRPVGH